MFLHGLIAISDIFSGGSRMMKSTGTTVSSQLNVPTKLSLCKQPANGSGANNQPIEVEVTTSSGTKTKTMVNAIDQLAVNGAQYKNTTFFFQNLCFNISHRRCQNQQIFFCNIAFSI